MSVFDHEYAHISIFIQTHYYYYQHPHYYYYYNDYYPSISHGYIDWRDDGINGMSSKKCFPYLVCLEFNKVSVTLPSH